MCASEKNSPRIEAYETHKCVRTTLDLKKEEIIDVKV
jgi:hypothetical protein